jgi:coenzyme F420-0:L-glutamate ligase / coenzyme F420-1:gamma-L-glutamate ligase
MTLTITPISKIPLIRPGNNLADIILHSLSVDHISLIDGDIIVLSQKIVSKAEGRIINLSTITPSKEAEELALRSEKDPRLVELILRESKAVLRIRSGTLIVEHKLGFICASAGIDHSNVRGDIGNPEDWVLLLPEDPDLSADKIRQELESKSGKHLGVMIIDSHGRAWRLGVVGTCIGLSGIPALIDQRGKEDLFGYRLKITIIGAADELAAAASLVLGEAAEGTPVAHVRGFPYPLRESSLSELLRQKEQDLFR